MQMFPAVLALVAIYAIFDRIGNAFPASASTPTGRCCWPTRAASRCTSGPSRATTTPSRCEIEEAAKVDGATPWQAFRLVLLPMAVPILMVVFLLAFIGAIIEYPVASVLLHAAGPT